MMKMARMIYDKVINVLNPKYIPLLLNKRLRTMQLNQINIIMPYSIYKSITFY